ncbi:UDP-glucose 4-epimerase GalE [Modestobacter versicolor]|uniref:UDP-glucose 4-epimerase GalE n=1 Tax=Modestobacter versicolor TaxID=429133 RepID=UPI0034DDF713
MTWLVTGGAGYIGSHVVAAMTAAGQEAVVLDDLSTGLAHRVAGRPFELSGVHDEATLAALLARHQVTGIVHLAAKKQVAESVARPLHYYEENVEGLRRLLSAATTAGVGSFVFSSSAAVYGAPDVDVVTEETDCRPVNPYGRTKLVGEWLVDDVSRTTGLRVAKLRYFNVAGAGRPELADTVVANLVTQVFDRLEHGRRPLVFGDDYATPDGTCVRDYVHVADIAAAHVAAALALSSGEVHDVTANIGRGEGVSVREMCRVIADVTGAGHDPEVVGRRPGDPARVVASASRAAEVLGWRAERDVEEMVRSAWAGWRQLHDTPADEARTA